MTTMAQVVKGFLPAIALDIVGSMRMYKRVHGTMPNIFAPKTFNEKIIRRSLFDNRPLLRQFADKYAVRAFVEGKLGPELLPKLYHVTENPESIPFAELPDRFVVKPTHGSGWIRIVRQKTDLDILALIEECKFWLSQNFYKRHFERIYKDIPPKVLVEEFVDDGTDGVPVDYKFLVFHGRVEVITPIYNRLVTPNGYFLDRDWKPLDAGLEIGGTSAERLAPEDLPPPKHLKEMIQAAEILGHGLDFVRVDFYDTPEKIYFGEITTTPGAGLVRFAPHSFDEYLGLFW